MNLLERRRQFFRHIDRSMLAPGAANSDGEVIAVKTHVLGNPFRQECQNILVHLIESRLLIQEFNDILILARLAAQRCFPVGVRQTAQIEHKIRVRRYSVFEPKRLNQHRQHSSNPYISLRD